MTPYREHIDFKPFGPVENGSQVLYGLDYRMAAWRGDEENPFHTEVGYWMWDAGDSEVIRCFMIPRGSAIVAGAMGGARRHEVHPGRRTSAARPTGSSPTGGWTRTPGPSATR